MVERVKIKLLSPEYRYKLHSKLVEKGIRTQKEAAKKLNASPGTISLILNGFLVPSPPLQIKLAEFLEIDVKELREILS